jgi:DNA-binding response OmpR family regulator
MARVLVAEDDPKQAELIRRYAVAEGHLVTVAVDGRAALDEIRKQPPDLLILDLMMPRLDGKDVCRIVRVTPELRDLPILMLTARAGEDDMLDALDLGADDYLTKPYSPRELMGRARALLRRAKRRDTERDAPSIEVGELSVSPRTHEVRFGGVEIDCTPAEFALVQVLAAEPGRVFSRSQLVRQIHGDFDHPGYVTHRTVDVHVANLRKKLPAGTIRTVRGIGYSLPVAAPDVSDVGREGGERP